MPRKRNAGKQRDRPGHPIVRGIYGAIDIGTAVLLLTGQIGVRGLFVGSRDIYLSVSGPMFGGGLYQGTNKPTQLTLDAIDVLTALLIIIGQLTVVGPYVSSQSMTIVVSGPPLGVTNVPVPIGGNSRKATEFYAEFKQEMIRRYILEPHVFGEQ